MSHNQHRGRGGPAGGRGGGGRGDGRGGGRGGRGGGPGDAPRGGFGGRGRGGRGDFTLPVRPNPGAAGPLSVDPGIYLPTTAPPAPDPKITALENDMLSATKGKIIDGHFPGRSSYGTKGTPIVLRTNHFHLTFASESGRPDMNKTLYRYEVSLAGNDVPRMKKRRAIEQLLASPPFEGHECASDYASIIVTTADLKHTRGQVVVKDEKLSLPPKGSTEPLTAPAADAPKHVKEAAERNKVRYKLTYIGSFDAQDLLNFLTKSTDGAFYASYRDFIQLLNLIICRAPNRSASVASLPGNRFYPHQGHPGVDFQDLDGGLVALRGYFSSVRPAIGRVLLNMNVTSGAFYQPIPLLDLLQRFRNPDKGKQEAFIRTLKVLFKRPGKVPLEKQMTIAGFAKTPRFGNARSVTFKYEDRNGKTPQQKTISVLNYFKDVPGVTLSRPDEPVVNVGSAKDPIYVPMEFCSVLPGQRYSRFLSGEQTTQMLNFAARFPNQNAMSIAGDATNVGAGVRLFQLRHPQQANIQAQSVQPFGFRVNPTMLTVPGRILNTPAVHYGKDSRSVVRANNGSWNCANQKFITGGAFSSWAVVILNVRGPRGNALTDNNPEALFEAFAKELTKYGLSMGKRHDTYTELLQPLAMPNRDANNRILDELFRYYDNAKIPMLFIVLPDYDKWLYARIKYYADTQYGIHTVCAVGKKFQKPNGQGMFFGNLALKINVKGGGVNHTVPNALMNPIDANTMLMGIDVTHPSPASAKGAPSIAVAVASRDRHLYQWPGSITTQQGKQEMVDADSRNEADCVRNLKVMVKERLECWRKTPGNNNSLPKKILLYRDGVSEGQYQLVLDKELPHFMEAFDDLYGAKKNHPKMAIIVVGKRHHVRFYPTKEADADYNSQRQKGSLNCKPGTVVDRGITSKGFHDFYLQAHQGLQGTARSAHYVVIKDDLGFDANSLEAITHSLCYMFARATKAVSVVPPAYYADVLAERARAYLYTTLQEDHGDTSTTVSGSSTNAEWDGEIHENLKDSFFYL